MRQIQADGTGRRFLAQHDIDGKILHRWVKHLFYLTVQAVNLIHKQHISLLEIVQNCSHLSRLLDGWTGSHLHVYTHLIGNDAGKRGLAQSRRAVKQHMIQRLPARFCRIYVYF